MFVDNTVYINFVLIVIDFVKAFCYTQIAAIAVWFDIGEILAVKSSK